MIVFGRYRLMEKLIGLNPIGGRENGFLRIVHLFFIVSFDLMESIFIILNIDDGIDQVAPGLAPLFGTIPPMVSYVHLLINRGRYYSLMNDLQDIVNESASNLQLGPAEFDIDVQ